MTKPMIDLTMGERWFPKETGFEEDLPLYWGDWGVSSEVKTLKAVLLRRPGKEVENFDAEKVRFTSDPLDVELLRQQHDNLAKLYEENNIKVYYVDNQRVDRPNAIYCRDLMFMTPEGAIVGRPGMHMRRGEERYLAESLAKIGVPIIKTISGDGIFEGANAMWVDRKTVVLSTSSRTNRSGYEQVETELKRMGVSEIIPMQIPYSNIHIDGIMNMVSEDIVMVYAPQTPYDVCDAFKRKGIKVLEAPSEYEVRQKFGINFVALEPGVVVQPDNCPLCKELLEKNGVRVITIDISEIIKGRGALHCVTAFLKRG